MQAGEAEDGDPGAGEEYGNMGIPTGIDGADTEAAGGGSLGTAACRRYGALRREKDSSAAVTAVRPRYGFRISLFLPPCILRSFPQFF